MYKAMSVSSVEGRCLAISHVFRTSPKKFFIHLYNGKDVFIVAEEEQEHWHLLLRVNSTFHFSHVVSKNGNFKGRHRSHCLNMWAATADSTCSEVVAVCPSFETCAWFQVTGVFPPLVMYELEYSQCISLVFMAVCAKVPPLQEGQHISILGAHYLVDDCLFMCGRSRLVVRDSPDSAPPIVHSNLPLVSLVVELNFSIQDVLWLKKQHDIFKQKFSNQFLQDVGVNLELCDGLLERVLSMAVRFTSPAASITRSAVEEFLVHSQCKLDEPAAFLTNFHTLKDVVGRSLDFDSHELWAHSHVYRTYCLPEMPVVAYLDAGCGQWMLRDSSLSIPCIVTSLDHPSTILTFIGNFVALTSFHLVWEYFKTGTGVVTCAYLVVSACELHLVFDMQKSLAVQFGACLKCGRAFNVNHACINYAAFKEHGHHASGETHPSTSSAQIVCPKNILPGRTSPSITSCTRNNFTSSMCVRVLHKSAVSVFTEGSRPRCHFLGSLLEGADGDSPGLRLHYFELSGRLLMLVPLLVTGAVYKLQFPGTGKLLMHTALGFLGDTVKTNGILVLPQECSFCFLQSSQECKTSYSVSESLREGMSREVMDLEGFITNRRHYDPKFNSEKVTALGSGYGVPGCKTVLLRLKDVDDETCEMKVYLSKWGRRMYPAGLLPGSLVRLTMMEKRTASACVYFVSTDLTTVEVLNIVRPDGKAQERSWGEHCLLLHVAPTRQLVWGTLVLSRLLKVAIKVMCKNCGCLVQGGGCSFVGCHKKSDVQTSAVLTAIVSDARAKVIFVVKDKLVQQVLRLSDSQWRGLEQLAASDGELLYLFKENAQMCDTPTLGQEIFKTYCSIVAQKMHILHVQCRKYPPRTDSEFDRNMPVLYCVDIRSYRPVTVKPMQHDR